MKGCVDWWGRPSIWYEKALNADDVKAALAVLKATNLYGDVETPPGGDRCRLGARGASRSVGSAGAAAARPS